jgi:hypothetical protein
MGFKEDGLTHDRLTSLLYYDAESGLFTWKVSRRCVRAGDRAGRQHINGYRHIKIDQETHCEHRLAWFYCYRKWPQDTIDHKDGEKNNNKIGNLREATKSQNQFNRKAAKRNRTGFKGVSWCNTRNKWRATIVAHGVWKNLGVFERPEDAHAAYRDAALELHGEFARSDHKDRCWG